MPVTSLHRAASAVVGCLAMGAGLGAPVVAQALFQVAELDQQNFVLVAAPIGDGSRAQLNIYEQLNNRRPCFAVMGSQPAQVDPLLSTFDFTGICGRFLDANGYSVRIGSTDLAPLYRLSVLRSADDNLLMAVPTRADAGPEMVVARTQGSGNGFLQLVFEPGWGLKRRAYNGRNLGHVYVYRDSWPGGPTAAAAVGPDQPLQEPQRLEILPMEPQPLGGGS